MNNLKLIHVGMFQRWKPCEDKSYRGGGWKRRDRHEEDMEYFPSNWKHCFCILLQSSNG